MYSFGSRPTISLRLCTMWELGYFIRPHLLSKEMKTRKGKRNKGADFLPQTFSQHDASAASRLLVWHTFTCFLSKGFFERLLEFVKKAAYTYRLRLRINTTRNKLVDSTFLLSTMPKSRGGRPQGVVHQHAKLSKFHTDDGKVCYYFTCKYCDKAKETCKPGKPAKIPSATRLAEHLLYRCLQCPEDIKWPIARAHNSDKIKKWRANHEPSQSS